MISNINPSEWAYFTHNNSLGKILKHNLHSRYVPQYNLMQSPTKEWIFFIQNWFRLDSIIGDCWALAEVCSLQSAIPFTLQFSIYSLKCSGLCSMTLLMCKYRQRSSKCKLVNCKSPSDCLQSR